MARQKRTESGEIPNYRQKHAFTRFLACTENRLLYWKALAKRHPQLEEFEHALTDIESRLRHIRATVQAKPRYQA